MTSCNHVDTFARIFICNHVADWERDVSVQFRSKIARRDVIFDMDD